MSNIHVKKQTKRVKQNRKVSSNCPKDKDSRYTITIDTCGCAYS